MADVYYSPDQVSQSSLDLLVDNIKADRTDEDLLFQVLLDWGVDLTLPIRKETIQGKTVFFVDDDALKSRKPLTYSALRLAPSNWQPPRAKTQRNRWRKWPIYIFIKAMTAMLDLTKSTRRPTKF